MFTPIQSAISAVFIALILLCIWDSFNDDSD
jgi:phosphotransferase system  glucose/maltose/N-acetylglucosamine-specific IIC component